MARIMRNGQWVEIETSKAAREKVQADKAAQLQNLRNELAQCRQWYSEALKVFDKIQCSILDKHIASLIARIAKLS